GTGHEYAFEAVPSGQDQLILVWTEQGRGGSDIRAQRVYPGVGVASGWPATGVSVCAPPLDQNSPRATSDGADGVIVAWEDFRSGRPHIYAQRVTADGAIATGWPQDGLSLGSSGVDQMAPAVVSDSAGGALIAWQEFQSGLFQVRLQRLTGN